MKTGMTGWLKPDGGFVKCNYGEHHIYAQKVTREQEKEPEIIKNKLKEEKYIPMGSSEDCSYIHLPISGITLDQFCFFVYQFDKFDIIRQEELILRQILPKEIKEMNLIERLTHLYQEIDKRTEDMVNRVYMYQHDYHAERNSMMGYMHEVSYPPLKL